LRVAFEGITALILRFFSQLRNLSASHALSASSLRGAPALP